jgi:RND family efflux transporter MFP subunit
MIHYMTIRQARWRAALLSATLLAWSTACRNSADAKSADSGTSVMSVGEENVAIADTARLTSGPQISGSLAPNWEATIRAEVAGPVVRTYVERGERVSNGQVLARIDDRAIRDSYLSARAAVRTAQSASEVAKRNLSRTQTLVDAGAVAESQLEDMRVAAQNAEGVLADAQARLAGAEKQLRATEIRAPASGVVSERSVQAGDVVQPGTALFTVVDPSRMKLEASVPAERLGEISVGAAVEFTVNGYPGRTFEGTVDRVSPVADPATGQVQIKVALPNSTGRLVGGLFAQGRVASDTVNGIIVPESAVDARGLRPIVVRLKRGVVERVEVELGLRDEATERVQVTSGLARGDTVLLGAAQGIAPGTPVQVSAIKDEPVARR